MALRWRRPSQRSIASSPRLRKWGKRLGALFSAESSKLIWSELNPLLMSLGASDGALRRWIVQIYHLTPHRSLERNTPLQKWPAGMRKLGLRPPADNRALPPGHPGHGAGGD